MAKKFDEVYEFKIALCGIEPTVWRRIQVPASYSFWELHVAIQDAMGWLDSHLHVFRVQNPASGEQEQIGIPDEESFADDDGVHRGRGLAIAEYFSPDNRAAEYEYDLGDSWAHDVLLERIVPREKGVRYPRCLAGSRACPPEDCGGVGGFEELLEAISDPEHEDHESMLAWVGGAFDPERFDPAQVRFDDPDRRWKLAFGAP